MSAAEAPRVPAATSATDDAEAPLKRPRLEAAGLPPCGGQKPTAAADIEDIWNLHEAACAASESFYADPATGYKVFTRVAHERRGRCCGNGCRHCPFEHKAVSGESRAATIQQPAFLHVGASERVAQDASSGEEEEEDRGIVALSWSTGKDSFLTLRALLRAGHEVALVTTFDAATRIIANQEVHASEAERQAKHLDVSLVGVPLHPGTDYVDRILAALAVLRRRRPVRALAFGDLHLEHIRAWRDDRLGPEVTGVEELLYPLWNTPYAELHDDLESSGVPCEVSALGPPGIGIDAPAFLRVGALFGRELAEKAEVAGCDAFGERGEFHTLAKVWEVPRERALQQSREHTAQRR